MKIGEVKTLQKTIRSTCDIKEKNTIIFKEDLPVADSNYELHLMGINFHEGLCVQAISERIELKVSEKGDVIVISTPKD